MLRMTDLWYVASFTWFPGVSKKHRSLSWNESQLSSLCLMLWSSSSSLASLGCSGNLSASVLTFQFVEEVFWAGMMWERFSACVFPRWRCLTEEIRLEWCS